MFGTMYERNWSHCANQLVITNLLTPRTWVLLSFCLWSFEVGTIMYPHRCFSKIILLYTSLKGTKEEKWKEMEPIMNWTKKELGVHEQHTWRDITPSKRKGCKPSLLGWVQYIYDISYLFAREAHLVRKYLVELVRVGELRNHAFYQYCFWGNTTMFPSLSIETVQLQ